MSLWRRVLTERRRVVLPLLVLLGANVAAAVFVVVPLARSVGGREIEALDAMADLALARREEAQARAAREGALGTDEDLRTFYESVLPQGFDGAVQVTGFWLTRIAEQTGVQFERGKYDRERIEGTALERMTAQATLKGTYEGVRRFLYAVETANEFVTVDRIELAQPADQSDVELELLLDVSTYYVARVRAGARGGAQ
ncbi:MAG TPA: GspMb/PilO family protein [Vicinamibacterales bacterium]|nr:GspMb/PilO family protein [Vicinamibacterales bacterium]